jgi:hypothetical protein
VSESKLAKIDLDLTERACARLGDAVIDPAVWPELMADICAGVGAQAALLLQSDVRTFDVPRTPNFEECAQYYFGNNWHLNDTRAKKGVPLLLAGESVIIDEDIFTPDETRHEPFFNSARSLRCRQSSVARH